MSLLMNSSIFTNETMIKEDKFLHRTIHFLIPSLSADEPAHILSLPETFAIQESPLEIPLPSGKCILAPSPSELFHYYQSVQPQMNHILSSTEGILNDLTSENFTHLVENLCEYSIPCPVLENHIFSSVDKSTSMISMDELSLSNSIFNDDYFNASPLYETCYIDSLTEPMSIVDEDPNLFTHHEQLISSTIDELKHSCASNTIDQNLEVYPSSHSYSHSISPNASELPYSWTSVPVSHGDHAQSLSWKSIHPKKKPKLRHSRKRTKFSSEDLEILNLFFEKNPMPSRSDISILSEKLSYPRYIVQVWFYNKRQSLKRANSSSSQWDSFSDRSMK